jgi:DNA repair exonuclease SbcCD nuclease subunit
MSDASPLKSCYPVVICSDLHLTDKESDEYRWSIFDRIIEAKPATVILLGDLTDAKDHHSARLVNRVVSEVVRIAAACEWVFVLKGNHDYLQKEHPFFAFLSRLERVEYISTPLSFGEWLFIPHSRSTPLPGLELVREHHRYCFMHQTFSGARTSNGDTLTEGVSVAQLPHVKTCAYISGDIHVPQELGRGVVEYVGSPYPIHFGDTFKGRLMRIPRSGHVRESLVWDGLQKHTVEIDTPADLDRARIQRGDQVKVRINLPAAQLADWHAAQRAVSQWCDRHGVKLAAVELSKSAMPRVQLDDGEGERGTRALPATDALLRYCEQQKVDPSLAEQGLALLALSDDHAA